jgi:hypothetical protein
MNAHPPRLPRLGHALHQLLRARRIAALATLDAHHGAPSVSMVPFALDPVCAGTPCVVLHISALAAHTANLQADARASLLITAAEVPDAPVHDLPRITLDVLASTPAPDSPAGRSAHAAYVRRFPEAEFMTALGDFRFITLVPTGARQIAGFGSARTVGAEELAQVLAMDTGSDAGSADGGPAAAAQPAA